MYTKHSTQRHFAGMGDYSVGMPNIYLTDYLFALMFMFGVCKVCSSKIARSKPKIKGDNEPYK